MYFFLRPCADPFYVGYFFEACPHAACILRSGLNGSFYPLSLIKVRAESRGNSAGDKCFCSAGNSLLELAERALFSSSSSERARLRNAETDGSLLGGETAAA